MRNVFTFTAEDVGQIRIVSTPEPMLETVMAAHPRASGQPSIAASDTDFMTELGSTGHKLIRLMQSPAVLATNFGASLREDSLTLEEALDKAMSRPRSEWRSIFAELRHHQLSPEPFEEAADGVPAAMASVAKTVEFFHGRTLGPSWPALRAAGLAVAAGWSHIMATEGIGALLSSLHSSISWQPPDLVVEDAGRSCAPWCAHLAVRRSYQAESGLRLGISSQGLVIRPTITSPFVHKHADNEGLAALSIPASPVALEVTDTPGNIAAQSALADVLGVTRSVVLLNCVRQPLSTSDLARRCAISIASASEHASSLRAAGLIQSHRDRQSVVHVATAIGVALVHNATGWLPRPPTVVTALTHKAKSHRADEVDKVPQDARSGDPEADGDDK